MSVWREGGECVCVGGGGMEDWGVSSVMEGGGLKGYGVCEGLAGCSCMGV